MLSSVLFALSACTGPMGASGKDGADGLNGADGQNGADGADGQDGADGVDGVNGADGADGQDGVNGTDGVDGQDGQDGADGADGADGVDGQDGEDGEDGFGLFDPADLDIVFDSITASSAGGYLSLAFTLSDGTDPVEGVDSSLIRIYIAELVPGAAATDSDEWYRWAYERDSTSYPFGTFEELGDGNYTYTFATPLADAPDAANPQRMMFRIRGLDGYNAVNGHYDFMIADPTTELAAGKDIVTADACNACHGSNVNDHGHGGGYTDTKSCVMCHSPLYTDEDMEAAGFDFVTMIHQIHSAIDGTASASDPAAAMDWSEIRYPGDLMDCETCHQGTDGSNYADLPTMTACSSCHVTVDFAGADFVGINGDTYAHSVQTDNSLCSACHTATTLDSSHPLATDGRTLTTTITGVSIDDDGAGGGTGKVTVTFTAFSGTTPVTSTSNLTSVAFTLAQLQPGEDGASNHWVSYTARTRSKNHAGVEPVVLQGYAESSSVGTLTHVGSPDGTWTYVFGLQTADTAGDIRTVTHAHDANTSTLTTENVVEFDRTLTHRVGMECKDGSGVANVTNATYDFVPNGDAVTETRDLVSMDTCNDCHDGQKLHKGYATEYCVTCHNQSTFDPYTEDDPVTIDLQTMVHKLHMGEDLPSVAAGGSYDVSHHDYSDVVFPQPIVNCTACHTSDGWQAPTSRACGSCHDSDAATAHIDGNIVDGYETCTVCHDSERMVPVLEAHQGVQH